MRADQVYFKARPTIQSTHPIVAVGDRERDSDSEEVQESLYNVVTVSQSMKTFNPKKPGETVPIKAMYLVPYYPIDIDEDDVSRRDLQLLTDRANKIFEMTERGARAFRTREQLEESRANLAVRFKDFGFSKSLREHDADERQYISEASLFVRQAVTRLLALGTIIIQGNRNAVDEIEYDNAYIAEHKKEIAREFIELHTFLIADPIGMRLCDCVMTRNDLKDRDRAFSQLISEMGKPVAGHIRNLSDEKLETIETSTIRNLVYDIGATMLAIDQCSDSMLIMLDHKFFGDFINKAQMALASGHFKSTMPGDLDFTQYRGMVREFIELSRARAGIRSQDAANFDPLYSRLHTLEKNIKFMNEGMLDFAGYREHLRMNASDKEKNEIAKLTVPLLERGIVMISEMSDLRLPRISNASGINGRESSVDHYHQKVIALRKGNLQAGLDPMD